MPSSVGGKSWRPRRADDLHLSARRNLQCPNSKTVEQREQILPPSAFCFYQVDWIG